MVQAALEGFVHYFGHIPYVILALAIVALGMLVMKITIFRTYRDADGVHHKIVFAEQLFQKDNTAFWVILGCGLLAQVISMGGALLGAQDRTLQIVVGGLAGVVLIPLSLVSISALVFRGVRDEEEIFVEQNLGTGGVWGGAALATGFNIFGVVSGTGASNMADLIANIVVYWLIGQVFIIVLASIFKKTSGYDVEDRLKTHNSASVGIIMGGQLTMLGIVAGKAFYGTGSNMAEEIGIGLVYLIAGTVVSSLLAHGLCYMTIGRKRVIAEIEQTKDNVGMALGIAFIYVCVALVLSFGTHPQHHTSRPAPDGLKTQEHGTVMPQ